MNIWISPHNDDEVLFGAFTLMREKPLVVIVTDSYIQAERGEKITADQRWEETRAAMKILGCPVIRLGIRDDIIDKWAVENKLSKFTGFYNVYIPALEFGNPHHDLINEVVQKIGNGIGQCIKQYRTYSKLDLHTIGGEEIVPTQEEIELKNKALACYTSQLNLAATKPHFDAVYGKSEWFI